MADPDIKDPNILLLYYCIYSCRVRIRTLSVKICRHFWQWVANSPSAFSLVSEPVHSHVSRISDFSDFSYASCCLYPVSAFPPKCITDSQFRLRKLSSQLSLNWIRFWLKTSQICSVVDPNTLNLHPDPGFRANLDPDPGLNFKNFERKIQNNFIEKISC